MPKRIDSNPDSFTIEIFIGAAYSEVFELANADGSPMDISGFTFTLILKDVFEDTFKLVSGDAPTALGSLIAIEDGPNGKLKFTISDEETEFAREGGGRWALQVDEGDGLPYILYRDEVCVQEI